MARIPGWLLLSDDFRWFRVWSPGRSELSTEFPTPSNSTREAVVHALSQCTSLQQLTMNGTAAIFDNYVLFVLHAICRCSPAVVHDFAGIGMIGHECMMDVCRVLPFLKQLQLLDVQGAYIDVVACATAQCECREVQYQTALGCKPVCA